MPQSVCRIRQAINEDSGVIFSMAKALATTFVLEITSFKESFDSLEKDQTSRLLVAEDGSGLIVGYLLGFTHPTLFANGTVGWIEEMYVRDDARRSGVGTQHARAFEEWAAREGATLIALATRRATTFYLAMGFEESAAYFRKLL